MLTVTALFATVSPAVHAGLFDRATFHAFVTAQAESARVTDFGMNGDSRSGWVIPAEMEPDWVRDLAMELAVFANFVPAANLEDPTLDALRRMFHPLDREQVVGVLHVAPWQNAAAYREVVLVTQQGLYMWNVDKPRNLFLSYAWLRAEGVTDVHNVYYRKCDDLVRHLLPLWTRFESRLQRAAILAAGPGGPVPPLAGFGRVGWGTSWAAVTNALRPDLSDFYREFHSSSKFWDARALGLTLDQAYYGFPFAPDMSGFSFWDGDRQFTYLFRNGGLVLVEYLPSRALAAAGPDVLRQLAGCYGAECRKERLSESESVLARSWWVYEWSGNGGTLRAITQERYQRRASGKEGSTGSNVVRPLEELIPADGEIEVRALVFFSQAGRGEAADGLARAEQSAATDETGRGRRTELLRQMARDLGAP